MFLHIRQKIAPLIILPKDFNRWLENNYRRWDELEPAPLLVAALEHQDRESVLAAYTSCEKLFRKAYRALQRGKYRQAAKYYVMAGFDRTYFEDIIRWDLASFEDKLAREVYHRNYGEVGYPEALKIMDMLPARSHCDDCGFKLIKPKTAQVKCPNCGLVQTYAKHDRDLAMAMLGRSMFADDYKAYRRTFLHPRAALPFVGIGEVRELLELAEDYL